MGPVLRRALGGLLIFGLLVAALAYYTYSPYLMLTVRTGPPDAAEPASSPTPRATRSATPTSVPTPDAPDAGRPLDPGGRDPGIRLVATVGPNRVFDVIETVRLPEPVSSLTLLPPDIRQAGGDLRSARPFASNVVVRVNGRTVRPPRGTVRGNTVLPPLRRATDRFEVRYRLTDAIEISAPSWADRAIGAVGPLVSQMPADLPVAIAVQGRAVSNLNCVRLPPDQRTCMDGRKSNRRVDRNLAYRDALVQVQLDLKQAPRKGR